MMSLLAGNDATANCFATLLVICTIDRINTLEYAYNNFVYYPLRNIVFVMFFLAANFEMFPPFTQSIDHFRQSLAWPISYIDARHNGNSCTETYTGFFSRTIILGA